jgi:GTP cyclohydrolase II
MHSYLTQEEQSIRQISDLKFGIPIIVKNNNKNALIISIETLTTENFEKLKKFFSLSKPDPYIAVTKKRADLLKARVYENDIARLKIQKKIHLNWIKATADPSLDLEYPMKGPYESFRNGDSEIARIGIKYCKEAELLPATLVIPIDGETAKKLEREGLLYQNISKSIISKKSNPNPVLISSGRVPLRYGLSSKVSVFRDPISLSEHYAVEIGTLDFSQSILTRLHSACFTGDILHSLKCDCGEQLDIAINKIKKAKCGIILYLNQEGRGIGLANKMRAYKLQDAGLDTFESNHQLGFEDDERDFTVGTKILKELGVRKIDLLTNNPLKVANFKNSDIQIVSRVPLVARTTNENKQYLETKKRKSGHIFAQN